MNKVLRLLLGCIAMNVTLNGQQLQLKWETPSTTYGIIYSDLGSERGFFLGDSTHLYFYDGNTHSLKWTLKVNSYEGVKTISINGVEFASTLTPLLSPSQDYDGNGVRDLFLEGNLYLRLVDPSTGIQLAKFDSAGTEFTPMGLADVDGDGKLDLLMAKVVGTYPNWVTSIQVYSTNLSVTSVSNSTQVTPSHFQLQQNYPNPFNPSTTIDYQLSGRDNVDITIYDNIGREVKRFVLGRQEAGIHSLQWDGKNDHGISVATGTYFYQARIGDFAQSKKMLLLK